MYAMQYMVTFTINIPQMLANIPYMDPMGMLIDNKQEMWIPVARTPQSRTSSEPSWSVTKMLAASPRDVYRAGCRAGWSNTRHVMFPKSIITLRSQISIHYEAKYFLDIYNVWTFNLVLKPLCQKNTNYKSPGGYMHDQSSLKTRLRDNICEFPKFPKFLYCMYYTSVCLPRTCTIKHHDLNKQTTKQKQCVCLSVTPFRENAQWPRKNPTHNYKYIHVFCSDCIVL